MERVEQSKLLDCEIEFSACFCTTFQDKNVRRLRDNALPDMHTHNFSVLAGQTDDTALVALIEQEIKQSRLDGHKHCMIFLEDTPSRSTLNKLSIYPEVSRYAYYVAENLPSISLKAREDCTVLKVDSLDMVDERTSVDIASRDDASFHEFCRRKGERNAEVYLAPGGVDAYLCKAGGKTVGKADYFCLGDIAMIDDFDVSPEFQREGYGTSIIDELFKRAILDGAKYVLFVTDMDDTAKEVYAKIGCAEYKGRVELFFSLEDE